jgi:ESCRT-I complex subunit VPS28
LTDLLLRKKHITNVVVNMDFVLQISHLPPDFSGKQKAVAWYTKLNPLPASYQLPDDDVRQLLFDLESCYNDFMASIR